jgi:hypothetical protein
MTGVTGIALTAAAASPPTLAAQTAPVSAAAAPADAKSVVAEIRRLITENYVVPAKRPALDAALAKGLASGRYAVTDPRLLAERINADLEASAQDKHLGLSFDPQQAALIQGRQSDEGTTGPVWERMAQVRNHGFSELRVMPGNVRYAALDGFVWTGPKTQAAYDATMAFLKDGDAAIIDLRNNGGGSPEAVRYLVSHFMEPERPLVTFYMGASGIDRVATHGELPAGRMIGKPLYVLTSSRSASAAEEFAGHVAGFKLGELVGETTAGAAFRNEFFTVPGGYVLSVSVGRPELAATGGDWEGKGIAPTLKTEFSKALDVAHLHALRRLAKTVPPQEKPQLEGAATLLAARIEPIKPALPLAAYAGRFGERTVSVENGRLVFQRAGGPKSELITLGPNLFALEMDPMTRLDFTVSGDAAPSFDLIRGDGSRMKQTRTQ